MKPIIGEISYKDMKPEDVERFIAEAQAMRSAMIHDMLRSAGRSITALARLPFKKTKVSISRNEMVGAQ